MKFKKINGVKYLVKENGEVTDIKVTEEQATTMEEVKEESDQIEDASQEIAKMIQKSIQTETKGLFENVKTLMSDEFSKTIHNEKETGFLSEDGKKSLTLEDVKKGLSSIKESAGRNFSVNIKTLSELNSLTGNVILEDRKTDITREPVRPTFVQSLITNEGTTSDKVTYTEVVDETGSPATTAELAVMPNKDYEFGVFQADVKKVSVTSKASNEILEDAPQLVAKVREMLLEDMDVVIEDKILFGSGTAGDFTGIFTIAPSFVAGAFAGNVQSANRFDVLRIAIQNITKASKSRYMPTAILLNPEDITKMELTKDANNNYVMPPFLTADKTTIKSVRIYENPAIPEGEFLVGDMRKVKKANRRDITLNVATENADDFEKDLITMRVTVRFAVYVRNNDIGAFVKGNFDTAIGDIQA